MGQQQILLIVLSVILVGIAIAVGITMFQAQAKQGNIDAIISDLNNLGSVAYQYRIRPITMGGGGGSFIAFGVVGEEPDATTVGYWADLPDGMRTNQNADYIISELNVTTDPADPVATNEEYIIIYGRSKTQSDANSTSGQIERYILVGPDGILSVYTTLVLAQAAAATIGT